MREAARSLVLMDRPASGATPRDACALSSMNSAKESARVVDSIKMPVAQHRGWRGGGVEGWRGEGGDGKRWQGGTTKSTLWAAVCV